MYSSLGIPVLDGSSCTGRGSSSSAQRFGATASHGLARFNRNKLLFAVKTIALVRRKLLW